MRACASSPTRPPRGVGIQATLALALLSLGAACAHRGPPAPAGPTRQLAGEAARITRVNYEDGDLVAEAARRPTWKSGDFFGGQFHH